MKENPENEGDFKIYSPAWAKQIFLYPYANQNTDVFNLADKFKENKEIFSMLIQIPKFEVSEKETYYYCKMLSINQLVGEKLMTSKNSATYHAIAFEPVIDNVKILHHIIVYSCSVFQNVNL